VFVVIALASDRLFLQRQWYHQLQVLMNQLQEVFQQESSWIVQFVALGFPPSPILVLENRDEKMVDFPGYPHYERSSATLSDDCSWPQSCYS